MSKKRHHDTPSAPNAPPDPRFASAVWDPRFSRVPKRAKKAVDDERFQQDLKSNPAFYTTSAPVDRFGRPKHRTRVLNSALREVVARSDDEAQDSDSDDDRWRDEEYGGSGLGVDEDSSGESEIDEELLEDVGEEEEENIPRGRATRRLAVMGLDWSTTRSVDIYASLHSFCPPGKTMAFVEVHPSKFGLQRLAVEARFGPQVIARTDLKVVEEARRKNLIPQEEKESAAEHDDLAVDDAEDGDDEQIDSDEEDYELRKWKSQKALRKYEEERLNYYYAVVQFEDAKSADAVYEQCDGVEFSQSGRAFDLRFIPDDMVIETTPRDRADRLPNRYKPPNVTLSSLNNSSVKLTWDADDPDRVILKKKVMRKREEDEENLKAYLAGSSDDESVPSPTDVEKKKNILLGADEEEQSEEEEMEMEISFEPGMLEKGEEIVKRKQERDERKDESAWEARLRRQGERKAEKKKKRRDVPAAKATKGHDSSHDDVENATENPAPTTDPLFSAGRNSDGDEHDGDGAPLAQWNKGKKKRENGRWAVKRLERAEEDELKEYSDTVARQQISTAADSDSDDERGKLRKSRGRRRNQREKGEGVSMLDVKDSRFQQLFDSHLYAVDPTHPKFRKDETSKNILREQATRSGARKEEVGRQEAVPSNEAERRERKSEAMELVARIKAKAAAKRKRKDKI